MKKIFLVVVSIVLFTSCEDLVDIQQPGRLGAEETFETVADLNAGLLGVYNEFDYTPAIQFNSLFTDQLAIGLDNGGQGIGDGTYAFVLNAASFAPAAIWQNYYRAISAATRIILAAELIEPTADEQAQYNNVLGQLHALRAWAHFELQTYFSPDLTDPNALGVIALDYVPDVTAALPRNTNAEVFALIEGDLATAESLLTTESNPTFVSLDFVTALRARMYAYRGLYAEADAAAAALLAKYPLANRAQYEGMFADTDNTEIIFKLERSIGDPYDGQGATGSAFAGGWAGAIFAFVNATISGSPYFEISRTLFNELNPADVRYDVLVAESSLVDPNYATAANPRSSDVLVVGKYEGSGGQPLLNDLKIFRASEMLLIRAEAAAAQNRLTDAATLLDQLVDARFGEDQPIEIFGTAQGAFRAILRQRNIELAFEGFRWVDLKRLRDDAGLPEGGIQRDPIDCAINGACTLPSEDQYKYALPIPIVELNANPTIRSQQNEGYTNQN